MSTIQVKEAWKSQRELVIVGNAHIQVLGGAAPRTIAKDVLVEITAVAPLHVDVNCKIGGGSGVHNWGLKLRVKRELWGQYFMPQSSAPAPFPIVSSNLAGIFDKLAKRQRVIGEGLDAMRAARTQLQKDIASGQKWATVAVLSNAVLLPLNIILNAFDVGAVVSIYQAIVKELYAKLARSGTRIDNSIAKQSLALIKKAVADELKRKGLTNYVPGVNIIVGLAEDSFALMEVMSTVAEGGRETAALMRQMDSKIGQAMNEFIRLGVEMERQLTESDRRRRTA
jgi:hypothetical protein